MKRFLVIAILLGCKCLALPASDTLKIFDVQELQDSMKVNPKPVIIYYYTDWCNYCRVMEESTLRDTQVIDSLNSHYYLVKFNGETKKNIFFLGRNYKFIKTGDGEGYHEFNYAFAKITGFPSFVFLSNHYETMNVKLGYVITENFLELLGNQE